MDIAPKIASTKLKLKIPTNPQLIAPIMTKTRAILSITFMKKSSLKTNKNCLFLLYEIFSFLYLFF
mgnify:CR=1 FL=1